MRGGLDQGDEIRCQATAGLARLEGRDADFGSAENEVGDAEHVLENLLPGLASDSSTIFSGGPPFRRRATGCSADPARRDPDRAERAGVDRVSADAATDDLTRRDVERFARRRASVV